MLATDELTAPDACLETVDPADDSGPCPLEPSVSEGGESGLRRDLRASLGDGAAYAVMFGIADSYLPAFVLALGMGEVAAGLMATVPVLGGALLQLASPWAVRRLGSHRRWVVGCAAMQAASLLILPLVALAGTAWGWVAFLAATLYSGAGLATGPAWNVWMQDLVPGRVRARFLARRSRFYHVGMMGGFLLGGVALQAGTARGQLDLAFAGLFVVAAVSRFASAAFLARQREGGAVMTCPQAEPPVRTDPAVKRSFARLLAYLLAIQAAVYMSGPYFTPYMLSELRFSYLQFALLVSLAFIGKASLLPLWGRLAQRMGARRLLWIGGIGIVPVSGLWLVSDHLGYLAGVQVFSGCLWAAYELAMLLVFFEAVPKAQRMRWLTVYNLGNSVMMVGGSLLGAALLKWLDATREAYLLLFALSSVARCVALLLLRQVPDCQAAAEPSPRIAAEVPLAAEEASVASNLPLTGRRPLAGHEAEPMPLGDAA